MVSLPSTVGPVGCHVGNEREAIDVGAEVTWWSDDEERERVKEGELSDMFFKLERVSWMESVRILFLPILEEIRKRQN